MKCSWHSFNNKIIELKTQQTKIRSADLLHCIEFHIRIAMKNKTSAENIQVPGPRGALNEHKLFTLLKTKRFLKPLTKILQKDMSLWQAPCDLEKYKPFHMFSMQAY